MKIAPVSSRTFPHTASLSFVVSRRGGEHESEQEKEHEMKGGREGRI